MVMFSVEKLGDEIAVLAMHIDAATPETEAQLLELEMFATGAQLERERVSAGGLCLTALIAGNRKDPLRVLS
jgi:hypothetical protein